MLFDTDLPTLIARIVALLIAFPVHELAHAQAADHLGDSTPRRMGRITLNPLAHLDPFGTLALLLAGFGWAKPVLVNAYNLRGNPRVAFALVALAGPVSNIFLAGLAALPVRFDLVDFSTFSAGRVLPSFSFLLFTFIWINVILAVFNMIPLPPLDGFNILVGIVPSELAFRLEPLRQYGSLILLAVIFVLPTIGLDVIGPLLVPLSCGLLTLIGLPIC